MLIEKLKFDFNQKMDNPNVLEIRLYGEVKPDEYDYWNGEKIESKTSQDYFAEELDKHRGVTEIILYINSCGGSVEQGYGIYANLKRHPAHKTCYIDGFANSIASIVAMSSDKIVMYPNSMMGIHNAMQFCFGNANELRKAADDLDKLMEGNRQIYLERSNGKITLEKLTELLDAETMLTAEECLQYGFCDEIEGKQMLADTAKAMSEAAQSYLNLSHQMLNAANSMRAALRAIDETQKDNQINIAQCMEKSITKKWRV